MELKKGKQIMSTQVLVRAGLLVALSIILSRVLGIMVTPTIKVSFGQVPLMIIGLFYGPIVGAIAGFVADMIGIVINIGGTFHLGFTLTSMLYGVLTGLISVKFLKTESNKEKLIIVLAIIIADVVCSLLNTIWLVQLYGTPFSALMITRLPKMVIQTIIDAIIVVCLYKPLKRV